MNNQYIWNSETNAFDSCRENQTSKKLYTQTEVEAIFAKCTDNKILIDVDGKPTIVDLYTVEELAEANALNRISELKQLLADTDYIGSKLAEALAENDVEAVVSLKDEYATELANRKLWRAEINSLEIGV